MGTESKPAIVGTTSLIGDFGGDGTSQTTNIGTTKLNVEPSRKSRRKKKKSKNKTQYFAKRESNDTTEESPVEISAEKHQIQSFSDFGNSPKLAPYQPPQPPQPPKQIPQLPLIMQLQAQSYLEAPVQLSASDSDHVTAVPSVLPRTSEKIISTPQLNGLHEPISFSKSDIPCPSFSKGKQAFVSPRKQTVMRHKKSDDQLNNHAYFQKAKENLKNQTNKSSHSGYPKLEVSKTYELDLEEKVTLFKYKSAKILEFDEQLNKDTTSPTSESSGRLLSHGEFEIFQLHNGDVTYLSCGRTFIYPLLPKVKILRINFNQFILPLQYPKRYWKIFLNSDEPHVMDVCQNTFSRLVKYSNLFNPDNSVEINQKVNNIATPEKLIPDFSIGAELPPSPPSAPISPHNDMLNHFLNHKISSESISTSFACLDTQYSRPQEDSNPKLQQPKPKRIVHRKVPSERSDSSMDSLLDEYEENISYSKYQTKMRSRQNSVISRRKDNLEDFPTTSLSEYNRSRNNYNAYNKNNVNSSQYNYARIGQINGNGKNSVRSRRSSRSDLYAPETGWMEPSQFPKTRSTYSISSCPNPELNNTYKSIYRSITQRNLRQYNDDELSVKSQRLPTIPAHTQSTFTRNTRAQPVPPQKPIDVKLDSSEIFRLISSGKQNQKKAPPATITSRLFGW